MISILIITLNEEENLPHCIKSVSWSDDIVVFDSFSTDRTTEIAKAAGARVFHRKFDNYAAQRNAALTEVKYKYPWVFSLDADERMTVELYEEIIHTVTSAPENVSAYRLRFKNYLFGKWLKHASLYPTWVIRLFRVKNMQYEERLVNAHPIVLGELRSLKAHFTHHTYNAGFHDWFITQNRHSSMEATELMKENKVSISGIFSKDPMIRRRNLKCIAFKLPGRPLIVFVYMYLIRLGFLDGRAGLTYCLLRAIYEYMIDVKHYELRRRKAGLDV